MRLFVVVAAVGLALCPLVSHAQETEEPQKEAAPVVTPLPEADEAPAPAPAMTPDQLRALLHSAREKVLTKLLDKMEAKQEEQLGRIATYLGIFSLAGLLLLFAPFVLRTRYPGQMGALMKYSALAAVVFVVAVNLFSVALVGLRTVQGALGPLTNPQLHAVDATFNVLDKNANELGSVGGTLLGPTLEQLESGADEAPHVLLLENFKKLGPTAKVFGSVAKIFKGLSGVLGFIPILLSILAVALFVKSFWPVLKQILELPARAVSGDPGTARKIVADTMRTVWRELLATVCLVGVLLLISIASGFVLAQIVEPAMEAILAFIVGSLLYLQLDPNASAGMLMLAMGGVALYLVLNVAVVTVASGLFLSRAQAVFRAKFHDKIPLRDNGAFWGWGALSFAWSLALPLVFALAAVPGVKAIFGMFLEKQNFMGAMLASAALLAFGLLFAFWLLRGLKAVVYLARYRSASISQERLARRAGLQQAA